MILHKNEKFIYIHIQKTAGTSLENILINNYSSSLTTHWHGRHGHASSGIKEIGQKEWNNHYSFAFVRNPWDRMVSWYSMIQEAKKKLAPNEQFKSSLWNSVIDNSYDFDSFLVNCTNIIQDRRSSKSFAFNQVDYISDSKGKVIVSFVGRFENLSDDMRNILKQLNLDKEIKILPKLNTSQHEHYSNYYTDKTKDLIAKRFKRDIEAFDYCFSKS